MEDSEYDLVHDFDVNEIDIDTNVPDDDKTLVPIPKISTAAELKLIKDSGKRYQLIQEGSMFFTLSFHAFKAPCLQIRVI
jgi:hypothetical protein